MAVVGFKVIGLRQRIPNCSELEESLNEATQVIQLSVLMGDVGGDIGINVGRSWRGSHGGEIEERSTLPISLIV